MSQRANPFAVGLFFVVAILLLLGTLFFFGAGDIFRKSERFVLYFEGSITGLKVGAPVTFQGVQIGQVADIQLSASASKGEILIPVLVDIDRKKFPDFADNADEARDRMIERGLRAQLKVQSVLTSLLMVEFDFFPGTLAQMRSVERNMEAGYVELPTIPTPLQELLRNVDELNVNELVQSTHRAINGIDRLVNHPDTQASITSFNKLMQDADAAVLHMDREAVPALQELRKTLKQLSAMTSDVHDSYPALAKELELALRETRQAVKHFDNVMLDAQFMLSEDSALYHDLQKASQDVSRAANSVQSMSQTLNERPESLIFGKPPTPMEEKP